MASTLPLRQLLPVLASQASPLADPGQQAFREAWRQVEALRAQLHTLRSTQAVARRAYWQQVGPLATATVAARRALYAPLEEALLGDYLTRAEVQQVIELLLTIAHDLETRFGEEEAEILARYAPPPPPLDEATEPVAPVVTPEAAPHERHAAEARAQRRARAAAQTVEAPAESLLVSTKAAYRELARRHHPDRAALAGTAAQQAQTALMQRVTAAYAAGDLAALLGLLAEGPATNVSEELLARYTRALSQQRTGLIQQIAQTQAGTDSQPWSGTEKQQRTRLRDSKRSLRAETDYLHALLRQLAEPATLRQTLRELAKISL